MTCRNCRYWDRERATDRAGRILRNRPARCLWASTEPWPASCGGHLYNRPVPNYMMADYGQDCACFKPFTEKAK